MFDDRETVVRLGAVHDEANADAPEKSCLTVRWPDDLCCRDAHDSLFVGDP
jgi:hypothetical protein